MILATYSMKVFSLDGPSYSSQYTVVSSIYSHQPVIPSSYAWFFSRQSPEGGVGKTVSQAVYEVAMEAGYAGASCSDTYSSCPYTSQQMMAVARVVLHQIEYSDEPLEQVDGNNN